MKQSDVIKMAYKFGTMRVNATESARMIRDARMNNIPVIAKLTKKTEADVQKILMEAESLLDLLAGNSTSVDAAYFIDGK